MLEILLVIFFEIPFITKRERTEIRFEPDIRVAGYQVVHVATPPPDIRTLTPTLLDLASRFSFECRLESSEPFVAALPSGFFFVWVLRILFHLYLHAIYTCNTISRHINHA